jgi:hypothetical protein
MLILEMIPEAARLLYYYSTCTRSSLLDFGYRTVSSPLSVPRRLG